MNCPKCGFQGVPSSDPFCPKCGVVFVKLGRERAPRPRPQPQPSVMREPSRASVLFNVVALSVLLSGGAYYGLQLYEQYKPSEGSPESSPGPSSGPRSAAEPIVVGTEIPAAQGAQALVLSGLPSESSEPDVITAPEPEPSSPIPRLPDLTRQSVTPALLERAESLAREYPGVEWLREYVLAAHFLLAGQQIRARRFREALNYVNGSEDWGARAGDIATLRAVIHSEQEEWEVAKSWAETAIAYGQTSQSAEMYHIVGKAHYYRQEIGKAVEVLEKALELGESPKIRASLNKALAEVRADGGNKTRLLAHFIVSYDGGAMESTGRMVIDTMDRSYASLKSQLGFEPPERVVVILYTRRDYNDMGGPDWSAGLFDGKIRVPVRGLERLDEGIKTTLHHELAHAFIHARAGKNAPRWIHEGIAEYVEGVRTQDNGELLGRVLREGQTFASCLPTARCDPRIFYPAASSMADYVIQQRGMGGIRDILTALGEGEDVDSTLRRIVGHDVQGLIRDWEHFIKRRYS